MTDTATERVGAWSHDGWEMVVGLEDLDATRLLDHPGRDGTCLRGPKLQPCVLDPRVEAQDTGELEIV